LTISIREIPAVQGLKLTAARGILTTRATRWWRWRTGWTGWAAKRRAPVEPEPPGGMAPGCSV